MLEKAFNFVNENLQSSDITAEGQGCLSNQQVGLSYHAHVLRVYHFHLLLQSHFHYITHPLQYQMWESSKRVGDCCWWKPKDLASFYQLDQSAPVSLVSIGVCGCRNKSLKWNCYRHGSRNGVGEGERPEMQFEQDECRKRLALHCKNAQSKLSEKTFWRWNKQIWRPVQKRIFTWKDFLKKMIGCPATQVFKEVSNSKIKLVKIRLVLSLFFFFF